MTEFGLNRRQRDAVMAHERHVLVSAGAGTGKTRTVIGRILYLLGVEVAGQVISEPVSLSRIAAITYTNAAAADLVRKLREGLRESRRRELAWEVDTARIGTIHRFCGEILGEFALRLGGSPVPAVLDEGEGRALADEAVRDALLSGLEDGSIPGLDDLVARHDGDGVIGHALALLDRSDVLPRLAERPDGPDADERTLVALARRALDLLEERLRELGAVDFDRMISWTRDLLRDDPYVRETLRRRVHTLIVDEYQDVDPVQQDIAYLLGDPGGGTPGTRLLLVGDPKQSIYRFRRADVAGWRRVERDFRAGAGEVVELIENYRSADTVLSFVEATVGRILNEPAGGSAHEEYEVPFAPLVMGKPGEQTGGPPVELVVVPEPAEGKRRAGEVRAIEAEAVARRARELHERDGIPWGGMAVLVPAWAAADALREALERSGAPVYVMRDEGFLERREIVDLIVALEAVRDPLDDRALFGFLRSPFVGLRDETLLAIATEAGRPPYWPRLPTLETPEPERVRAAAVLLRSLLDLRDRVTVDELLAELLDRAGYLAHLVLLGPDRDQAVANVRKFVRMARGRRQQGVGDFLRDVAAMRERKDRIPDAPLHGPGDEIVTITSIHGAKGLEWDVVFWCDVGRGSNRQRGGILIGRDRVALRDRDAEEQSVLWQELGEQEDREDEAERKRLWYVAATRARRRLVVSALAEANADKRDRRSAEAWLWELRESPGFAASVLHADPEAAPAGPFPESPPPRDVATLSGSRDRIPVALGRPRHSASEMLTFSRCERKHWFAYVMGLREPPVNRETPEFLNALARGQIVHDVLERLREEDELDGLLEDAIRRWDEAAPPPESSRGRRYREELRREIQSVAGHPEYRAVAGLPTAARELRFLRILGDGSVDEGALDLAAWESAGLVVLDVKTSGGDAAAARRKVEGYRPQRDVYVAATEAVSGLAVGRFAFHFSRAGLQIDEPVTDADREVVARRLADRRARMGGPDPPLTAHPWECRFCGYRAAGWCPGVPFRSDD